MSIQEQIAALERQDTPESHFELGQLYAEGPFEVRNILVALEHYEKASQAGMAEASFQIGLIHSQSEGIKADIEKANEYAQLTLKQDPQHIGACCLLSDVCIATSGSAKTLSQAEELSTMGESLRLQALKNTELSPKDAHPYALTQLAYAYAEGRDRPHNVQKAIKYWTLAAESGFVSDYTTLGTVYYQGNGVKVDYKKARSYFEKGLANYDAAALINLANFYFLGHDCPIDEAKGIELMEQAVALGRYTAAFHLGRYYMLGAFVPQKDFRKGVELIERASEYGHSEASLFLAQIFFLGKDGAKRDLKKSMHYYELAGKQGNVSAVYELSGLLDSVTKDSFPPDDERSLDLLKRAAIMHHPVAMVHIGVMTIYGHEDIEQDTPKGWKLITKAAAMGCLEAKTYMGTAYYEGLMIKRDRQKGLKLLKEAAASGDKDAIKYLKDLAARGKKSTKMQ